jgi:hypothetical protein
MFTDIELTISLARTAIRYKDHVQHMSTLKLLLNKLKKFS